MIETPRLRLRPWREADVTPFAAICADPVVMATLGPVMSLAETQALVERCMAMQARDGHCFWALERREDDRLIGWCGVIRGTVGPIEGRAEIGWRLASDCWGHGYASEAARATVDWVFAHLPDPDVWAITHAGNRRSRAVMERLGMAYRAGLDFDHPRLAADDPLLRHVTYALGREDWPVGAAEG
ncbi:GNAT family N-acetyltransferase [Novosphingobium huizhouense]|uniref:GNAT family N-acetyltransferase n=1 Tax=Novosphingobium huizhouense TaxID=2866625 RepID=UPI001CD8C2C2|nr:GNAT family N-acetyltransferase [Novosphingobium huizhouense]